jgi:hypothetical protein
MRRCPFTVRPAPSPHLLSGLAPASHDSVTRARPPSPRTRNCKTTSLAPLAALVDVCFNASSSRLSIDATGSRPIPGALALCRLQRTTTTRFMMSGSCSDRFPIPIHHRGPPLLQAALRSAFEIRLFMASSPPPATGELRPKAALSSCFKEREAPRDDLGKGIKGGRFSGRFSQ